MRHLLAERGLSDEIEIDSAGTGGWHAGAPADERMRGAASGRGYRLTSRARQITERDLHEFDLVVAMDRENLAHLERMAAGRAEVKLLSEFLDGGAPADVPDPYYGGEQGFETVLDMLEEAAPRILDHLLAEAR